MKSNVKAKCADSLVSFEGSCSLDIGTLAELTVVGRPLDIVKVVSAFPVTVALDIVKGFSVFPVTVA